MMTPTAPPVIDLGMSRNQILSELVKSPHGDLKQYIPVGVRAAKEDPEFYHRLLGYNAEKGQVRDAQVALPVIGLTPPNLDEVFVENSLAHMARLSPREFLRAYKFGRNEVKPQGRVMSIRRLADRYLQYREDHFQKLERSVVLHRDSLKALYSLAHRKPTEQMQVALNNRTLEKVTTCPPPLSLAGDVYRLKTMNPLEAAGVILMRKIPFLVAKGALQGNKKDPAVVLALMQQMTPTEFISNQKLLLSLGANTHPALKAAYEQGLINASASKKNTLKTTQAVEAVNDEHLKEKLREVQKKQIQQVGIDGNWLILGDRSPSMREALELAKQVAGTLTAMVKGNVYLIFFDAKPLFYDVTGLSLDQIQEKTKHVTLGSATSIGCGMQYAIDAELNLDGVAIVSDGGENTAPYFHLAYEKYVKRVGLEPTVYFYQTVGDYDRLSTECSKAGIDVQTFDLRQQKQIDYYSLPNMVQTMRVSRYSLLDQIMGMPLLTLKDVFHEAA